MINSILVSDLHGSKKKYNKLFELINKEKPDLIFIAGDLLPIDYDNFIEYFLFENFTALKNKLGEKYPSVNLLFGNDDPKRYESFLFEGDKIGLWNYIHNKSIEFLGYTIYGYAYSPPSPFQLKDWEKYDVSRFVDPGCISPEEGKYSTIVEAIRIKFGTIREDLENLFQVDDPHKSVFLFHTPPYNTKLDRAALDDKRIDHVPADVHVGSIAVRKFIESKQPYLTLHGHIHESTSITGSWYDKIGDTVCFNAAHNGKELSVIKFDLNNLSSAERVLI